MDFRIDRNELSVKLGHRRVRRTLLAPAALASFNLLHVPRRRLRPLCIYSPRPVQETNRHVAHRNCSVPLPSTSASTRTSHPRTIPMRCHPPMPRPTNSKSMCQAARQLPSTLPPSLLATASRENTVDIQRSAFTWSVMIPEVGLMATDEDV